AYISLNDINEAPLMNTMYFITNENMPAGSLVGNVFATDPDHGQTLTYSILSGNTSDAFDINPVSGTITVNNSAVLDFEVTPEFFLTILAQDNGNPVLSTTALAQIRLVNINETPTVNDLDFDVASYSPGGTFVGTVSASDPDLNQALSFSITAGNTDNAFAIDAVSGTISVANSDAVNYLINPVFNLTVTVQDDGSPVLSSSAAVNITVTPTNTAPNIVDQYFTVNENMPQGVIVGQVLANDPDPGQTLAYSITSGNTDNAFQITGNGILSIADASAIDFETNPYFTLIVEVTDNGQPQLSASALVTVTLSDLNEAPAISGNTLFSVNEHVSQGTQVGTISATDPDEGQALTYSIISGNTGNVFAIASSNGQIVVSGDICFENCSQYNLVVRVSDNGSPTAWDEETITIQLLDVNENPEILNQEFSTAAFAHNGTRVGTVVATDPDINQSLAFSLQSGNTDGAFTIDDETGELFVANGEALNPIENPLFTLNVTVVDNGNPVLSSSAIVTIVVSNDNNAPLLYAQNFKIDENQVEGTILGTIEASDSNPDQTLSFSIISGNIDNAFAVSASGELTVNNPRAVDHEINPLITLLVLVSDNGIPVLWAQAPVTISITDVNDPPAMLPQTYKVKENTPNKRYVCKVIATDQDPGDTFSFSIKGGNTNNAFSIQASTGRIFVLNSAALNFEENRVFELKVRSTDNHGAYSEQKITIDVTDVNEAPVVQSQSFVMNQYAPNGTLVGQVEASDPDRGQTLRYAISQGNTNGLFEIDQYTGELFVANSSAMKNSTVSTYILTVRVRDNGTPALSSNGYETITVNLNKESGEIAAESTPERLNLKLKVYPNPSSDGYFSIELEEDTTEETTLIITDLTGKKLREEGFSEIMIHRIDLSSLPGGVYLMHAQNGQKHSVSKLIRQ
ncbi:MAG: cadherin domain-containing protein, partial [Lentimicrobium sp.]